MRFPPLPPGRPVSLIAGAALAVFAPACGARIVRFDIGEREILRPAPSALDGVPPYAYAGFPLIPYSGPIFGGGFRFGSSRYGLKRNVAAEPDATHGDAWVMPWTITAQSATHLALALDYVPNEEQFPFAWTASLTYALEPNALEIEMSLTNRDLRPMPAGFGFHPYFARPAGSVLRFSHGGVWPPDSPAAVLQGATKPPLGLDFNDGIQLDGMVTDRCFDDWNGVATLASPGFDMRILASPSFGKLQLYVPWYDPYVCIEPVSNANDGFNRAAHGVAGHDIVVLRPGASMTGSVRIEANPGQRA